MNVKKRKGLDYYYMGVWLGLRIYWCIGFRMETPTAAGSLYSVVIFFLLYSLKNIKGETKHQFYVVIVVVV